MRTGLAVARELLRPGGIFLAKVFQGEELDAVVRELKDEFGEVRRVVPTASRKASSEIYLLAKGFRGGRRVTGEISPV